VELVQLTLYNADGRSGGLMMVDSLLRAAGLEYKLVNVSDADSDRLENREQLQEALAVLSPGHAYPCCILRHRRNHGVEQEESIFGACAIMLRLCDLFPVRVQQTMCPPDLRSRNLEWLFWSQAHLISS
jgi:hypothetical protein